MSVKDEIQGSSGYLKRIRNEYIPNTKEMARLAFERYSEQHSNMLHGDNVAENADEILKGLFVAETEIFDEKNVQMMSHVLPYYYRFIYQEDDGDYPETSKKFQAMLDALVQNRYGQNTIENVIETISDAVTPIIDHVSFSQRQSAKTRVGETLQNHLARIFDLCHICYESQQQKAEGGTIMDFVIPNIKSVEEMPDQTVNLECQTTLKDRFRLTTGKSTDAKIKRYLATITGAGIVTNRDMNDFTVNKVKEIVVDNNITLVVLREVKERILQMLSDAETTIKAGKSYRNANTNVDEIARLKRLCQKKVISYSELITRDIRSALVYWGMGD